MDKKSGQSVKSACAGVGAGFLSGLLGAGGGVLLVPLLRDWVGLDEKRAMATSVFCIAPICAASVVMYAVSGRLDFALALPYLLGGLVGGICAGFLFGKTPPAALRRTFGGLLLLGAVRQFMNWDAGTSWNGFFPSASAGALTGVLSGLGLGGGTLLMIWMTVFGGLDQHAAQAVNLLYFLPCSLGSMAGHIKNKQIVWKPALSAAGAGLPAGFLGAFIASRIDAAPLRIGFGILTALIGVREVLFRKQKPLKDE